MTHYFRIKHAALWQALGLGEHNPRFGQACRVLARGKNGNLAVEFEDGYRMITIRWGVRRLES